MYLKYLCVLVNKKCELSECGVTCLLGVENRSLALPALLQVQWDRLYMVLAQ